MRWALVFGKFNLVGLLGAGLQLLLVSQLARRFGSVTATFIAIEIVVLHNFIWHERFTWRDRRSAGFRSAALRLWRFQVGNGLVSLVGNSILIYCLVERLNVPIAPSTLCTISVCGIANFLLADRWVYS